ncbi:hypothetical protein DP107_00710 [Haloglomus irregulare]|jgi:hypothetical protein|uniref:Uncharacterized protein n=1 Tax=Haloglomus irregulare TaxID=2234134 RepID=A0A554NEB1_9EURY|nr:hypothetical protein [Haloglomus irregulare]TSD15737.1 hypothetical protein DP107_00710 [Haloglomus irregulare]
MDYTRLLSAVCGLAVALVALGAVVSLVTGPLAGSRAAAAVVTMALVVGSVVGMVVVGTRGSAEWLESGGYW